MLITNFPLYKGQGETKEKKKTTPEWPVTVLTSKGNYLQVSLVQLQDEDMSTPTHEILEVYIEPLTVFSHNYI